MKKIGKEVRFLAALLRGKTISRRLAKTRYNLGNPSATVLRIVNAGFTVSRVYTRIRIAGNRHARRVVKYSIK